MILRPLEPTTVKSESCVPAWPVVERLQRKSYDRCCMITQPSHAALAGEIAAALTGTGFAKLDDAMIRAIALHDSGWGPADAEAVTRSRAARPAVPHSFLMMKVGEVLEAWSQSIQIAQSVGPTGGFMVSRHFQRIADRRVAANEDKGTDRKAIERFLAHEAQRQKRLAASQQHSAEELELLTDILQLCDLLSLYFCCGARECVDFPECGGVRLRLRFDADGYKLDPPVIDSGTQFRIAALRFPWSKEKSSEELKVAIL